MGLSPGKSPALMRQEKMRSAVIEELLHVEKDFAKHLKVRWLVSRDHFIALSFCCTDAACPCHMKILLCHCVQV